MDISEPASRLRQAISRSLVRLGFRDDSYLLILAVLIGFVTAAAAVGFHKLLGFIQKSLYLRPGERFLYHGAGLYLLVLFPALGGLLVGVIGRYLFRVREGHGIVDVMESVIRTSGFQSPRIAVEKIITAAITIGSGGSAGAEGPIVQIGAGIASGVGQLFRVARNHMPVLIGCGSAAGISAIFNAPFGGVLFTLEVILQDFSVRAFTPVVVASVIAQVSELLLYQLLNQTNEFHPIFDVAPGTVQNFAALQWSQVGNYVVLGLLCGVIGVTLTRSMYWTEHRFSELKMSRVLKPAMGGAIVGLMGVIYVLVFGRLLLHLPKPVGFGTYPLPAFLGDGYGFIEHLIAPDYVAYGNHAVLAKRVLILLASLCILKIVATCITLGSGGCGGVIAPSLFLGATVGAVVGTLLQHTGWFGEIHPEVYALVAMGAVLAAVVHAPLASILICFEVTEDYKVMVPAMLTCIVATGVARLIFQDSVYTMSLRLRGIRLGVGTDTSILRRMSVEQVTLEPASSVNSGEPFQKILDLTAATGNSTFVVLDNEGNYAGMIVSEDIQTALLAREAIPLLIVSELARRDLPIVKHTDNLQSVLDSFSQFDVSHLPVTMAQQSKHVIGLISRAGLMRSYQSQLAI